MCLEDFKSQFALIGSRKPTHLTDGWNKHLNKGLYVSIYMYREINEVIVLRKLTNLNQERFCDFKMHTEMLVQEQLGL